LSFKPLLASDIAELSALRLPLWGSPKLDGVRVVNHFGHPMTRSLKPVRNTEVSAVYSGDLFRYMDGEIIAGPETHKSVFQRSQSFVMSFNPPIQWDFQLHVFDYTRDPLLPYKTRYEELQEALDKLPPELWKLTKLVEQKPLENIQQIEEYEEKKVSMNYEGIMLRDPNAKYKFGRSSLKEHILLKMKRFADDEATIVGFKELLSNQNTLTKNELGYAERKGGSENMIPMGTLGSVIVESKLFSSQFNIGSGFDAATRQTIWDNRDLYLGRQIKYKFQPSGIKDLPRFPIYLGFREPE